MAAPISLCTKEEQRSVIRWKVYQGPQSIKDFRHNTGTVHCRNGVCTNGLKNKNCHTNVTHGKGAGRLSTAITEDNFERERDMVLLDE